MKTNQIPDSARLIIAALGLFFFGGTAYLLFPSRPANLSSLMFVLISVLLLSFIVLTILYFSLRSKHKEVLEKMHLINNALDITNEAVLITDADANIEYVNPAFCSITGYKEEEVLGKKASIMRSDRHDAEFYKEMWESLGKTGQWQGEVWDSRKNGEVFPKWLSINSVKRENDGPLKYVGVFSDITSIKQTEEYVDHLTHYDSLTNLPNISMFREKLKQAMRHADLHEKIIGIMAINLNNFKYVNDTFGYLAGDQILRDVAQRLVQCVSGHDTVAGQGGDQFSIMLTELNGSGDAASTAKK